MTPPITDNENNVALIIYRIGQLEITQEKRFDDLYKMVETQGEKCNDRIEKVVVRVGHLEEEGKQIVTNTKEIDTLRSSTRFWDMLNSLAVIVAGMLGIGIK